MTQGHSMNIERAGALLEDFQAIQNEPAELTLFEIGGRGHFENPLSDLLAFFLDPEGVHGFADEILSALLSVLPQSFRPEPSEWYLIRSPRREWVTSKQNRIDLILESHQWVLALENKVFHTLNNDLVEYENDVAARLVSTQKRRLIRVVLSPAGETPNGSEWVGISYGDFVTSLKSRLGEIFTRMPGSKWLLFLREFILHLENTTMARSISDEQEAFIFERLGDVDALLKLKEQTLETVRLRLSNRLNAFFGNHEFQVVSWQDNWLSGPAMRFKPSVWESHSVLTLHLPFKKPGTALLICYIDKNAGDFPYLAEHGFPTEAFDDTKVEGVTRLLMKYFHNLDWDLLANALYDNLYRMIQLERPVLLEKESGG